MSELICILCPNGCAIQREGETTFSGQGCEKGAAWALEELTAPRRSLTTSVLVEGGELPLVSVRLTGPVPRERLFDIMAAIRPLRLTAPVAIGQAALADVLGLGVDVIVTKDVGRG